MNTKKSKRIASPKAKPAPAACSGVIVIDPTIIPACVEKVPDAAIVMRHANGQISVWHNGKVSLHPPERSC